MVDYYYACDGFDRCFWNMDDHRSTFLLFVTTLDAHEARLRFPIDYLSFLQSKNDDPMSPQDHKLDVRKTEVMERSSNTLTRSHCISCQHEKFIGLDIRNTWILWSGYSVNDWNTDIQEIEENSWLKCSKNKLFLSKDCLTLQKKN